MKAWHFLVFCLLPGLAAGCGPREIGTGTSAEPPDYHQATAADQLRYPMTGASRTQRMLYYYNLPEVMSQLKEAQINSFNRHTGINPSPEDPEYRAIPKERSPFRQ